MECRTSVTPRRAMATPARHRTHRRRRRARDALGGDDDRGVGAGGPARARVLPGRVRTHHDETRGGAHPACESAAKGKVLEVHRRVMMANHPDAGGRAFLSTKINEAKALLLAGRSGASREPL